MDMSIPVNPGTLTFIDMRARIRVRARWNQSYRLCPHLSVNLRPVRFFTCEKFDRQRIQSDRAHTAGNRAGGQRRAFRPTNSRYATIQRHERGASRGD